MDSVDSQFDWEEEVTAVDHEREKPMAELVFSEKPTVRIKPIRPKKEGE